MNLNHLADMIGLQGGAIVSASECTDEEVEQARKVGLIAVHKGHTYIYMGKIWMANIKQLLKTQENVRKAKEEFLKHEVSQGLKSAEQATTEREAWGY